MEMRHVNCSFEYKNMICEVQIMFSENKPSINYHVNHKLYEMKRSETLEGLAEAVSTIGT